MYVVNTFICLHLLLISDPLTLALSLSEVHAWRAHPQWAGSINFVPELFWYIVVHWINPTFPFYNTSYEWNEMDATESLIIASPKLDM